MASKSQDSVTKRRIFAVAVLALAGAITATVLVFFYRSSVGDTSDDYSRSFVVPSSDWREGDPQDAAVISGTLRFDDNECPYLENGGEMNGVVFPRAVGVENTDGDRMVIHEESGVTYAKEGEVFEYGGGFVDSNPPEWEAICGATPVAQIGMVQDAPAG